MHSHGLIRVIALLGTLAGACSSAQSSTQTSNSNAASTSGGENSAAGASHGRFVIAPMRLVPAAREGQDSPAGNAAVELRADGTLVMGERTVGRFTPTQLLDESGDEMLHIEPDGHLVLAGAPQNRQVQMNEAGEVVNDNGARVYIAPDGTPMLAEAGGREERFPGRFENYRPEQQRTAVMIVLALTMPSRRASAPSGSEAAPGRTAAPAPNP